MANSVIWFVQDSPMYPLSMYTEPSPVYPLVILNHLQNSRTIPLVSLSPLPTDPTFTLSNVTTAVESVHLWARLGNCFDVLDWRCESMEDILEYFITTVPNASWQTLSGGLYYLQEQAALERVTEYFERQPGMDGCMGSQEYSVMF